MMMREQQWGRSNCRHFRIDVCLHQRIYMRAFVNARNHWVFGYLIIISSYMQILTFTAQNEPHHEKTNILYM